MNVVVVVCLVVIEGVLIGILLVVMEVVVGYGEFLLILCFVKNVFNVYVVGV